MDVLALGLADHGPADGGVRGGLRRSTSACGTRWRSSSCTAALHLAYLAAGVGPGDEVIVPAMTFAATAAAVALLRRHAGVRRHRRAAGPRRSTPTDVAAPDRPAHKAVCASCTSRGYPAAVRELRALCDAHGLALIEDAAHAPSADARTAASSAPGASPARSASSPTRCSPAARAAWSPPTTTTSPRWRAALRSHGHDARARWSRHTGDTDSYDVAGLGYNYRLDEPAGRAAALAPGRGSSATIGAPARADARLPGRLAGLDGLTVPYRDDEVERSSCYVMPMVVDDEPPRRVRRAAARQPRRPDVAVLSRRSTSSPPTAAGSASNAAAQRALARTEITLPLFARPRRAGTGPGRRRPGRGARA